MTTDPQDPISDRLDAIEAKLAGKPKWAFPTASVLAVLPVGFGLYQFHLSNEFKKEDNETRALLAALEGETPSAICGNLSLLVEGGLVTDERLTATQALIDEITQKDRQQLDGGIGEFDCLPRIASEDSPSTSATPAQPAVTLAERLAAPNACFFDQVEVEVLPQHDQQVIDRISGYLETQGIQFAQMQIQATEWEINNYAGQIWYYSIDSRLCAKDISKGLASLGIDMKPRYYTNRDLPDGLPIRIWPEL